MGVSTSGAQLAGKLQTAAVGIAGASPLGVRAGAELLAASIRAASPSTLRNVGKRGGAKLGVRVRQVNLGPTHPVAFVKAIGPWQIHEFDTKPHPIPRLKGARSRQYGPAFGGSKGGMLRMPDGQIRRQVFHPGTKGKHTFAKGAAAVAPKVPRVVERVSVQSVLRTVF